MILRNVQRLEVVVVVFDLGTVDDGVAHSEEYVLKLTLYESERVCVTGTYLVSGNGNVELFSVKLFSLFTGFLFLCDFFDFLFDFGSYIVCKLTDNGTLLGRQLTHSAENGGKLSLFAKVFDP